MRAYIIKTENGYVSNNDDNAKLNECLLFSTRAEAKENIYDDETVVPVEITLIKRNKK